MLLRHLLETGTQEPLTSLIDTLSLRSLASSNSTEEDPLLLLCKQTIEALPREAEAVRQGNPKVVMKMIGHVMKASGGRADAKAAGDILRKLLSPP